MTHVLKVVRFLGVLAGLWILYGVVSAQWQIHEQTKDFLPSSTGGFSVARQAFIQSTLPGALLAILLLVPYGKTGNFVRVASSVLIVLLGAYFLSLFFGAFFFSERFVPGVIPRSVWVSVAQWSAFLLLQVFAILMLARKPSESPRQ
jgi:hypothetical protein